MNLLYDLRMLRAACPPLRTLIRPFAVTLIDLSILNYQHSEMRPERSLKDIAALLAAHDYAEIPDFNTTRYPSPAHGDAIRYITDDTLATLRSIDLLKEKIASDFGPDSPKLSPLATKFYSDLLWTLLLASESGVCLSRSNVKTLWDTNAAEVERIHTLTSTRHSIPMYGPGSDKAMDALITQTVDALDCLSHPALKRTEITKKVSTSIENVNLLLSLLPPDPFDELYEKSPAAAKAYEVLPLIQTFNIRQRMVGTYCRPLLDGHTTGRKETRLRSRLIGPASHDLALCFPDWFPVPSEGRESLDSGGGTKQGRVTCKNPPLLTYSDDRPRSPGGPREPLMHMKGCFRSRYRGGTLVYADYSQIELRIFALLSGDPMMIAEYEAGLDLHIRSAKILLEIVDPHNRRGWKEWTNWKEEGTEASFWRQSGKTGNFLVTFDGEAFKFAETVAADTGIIITLHQASHFVDWLHAHYSVGRAWQQELFDRACTDHRLVLPLTGQSRYFDGDRRTLEKLSKPTICNFPVQTWAANLTLCAWQSITHALHTLSLHHLAHVPLCTYDSLTGDAHPRALNPLISLYHTHLSSNWLMEALFTHLGRRIPIKHDLKLLPNPTPESERAK